MFLYVVATHHTVSDGKEKERKGKEGRDLRVGRWVGWLVGRMGKSVGVGVWRLLLRRR